MSDADNKQVTGFLAAMKTALKWYGIGCVISFIAFYTMTYLKMDIHTIATSFQISCGIFLGGMLYLKSQQSNKQ